MTAKEELMQYKYARKKVDETLEEYQKYKDRATKMTAIMSENTQRSNLNSDKVGDNAIKMADISREYEERWLKAENKKLEVERRIEELLEPYRTLLHKRYIEELNFEKIADDMGYSYVRITHLHGEALLEYEKMTIRDKTGQV